MHRHQLWFGQGQGKGKVVNDRDIAKASQGDKVGTPKASQSGKKSKASQSGAPQSISAEALVAAHKELDKLRENGIDQDLIDSTRYFLSLCTNEKLTEAQAEDILSFCTNGCLKTPKVQQTSSMPLQGMSK